jgi:hypothetical protein
MNAREAKRELKKQQKRIAVLDGILNNETITHCYIRKGSYYRPDSCGYTDYRHRAGVYTKEYAVSHAKRCEEITVVPIDIEEHNAFLTAEIQDIQSRLLA